jgi:RNAse (barnase) inhibitor barstar
MLLQNIRPNVVQAIRAYRAEDLQAAAQEAGQHFLYAHLADAPSKQDVLERIAEQFTFPSHFGKNLDALYDSLTDLVHKSGPQPGFVVVLELLPDNAKFDRESREQLLDVFREAADYWADRRVQFRVSTAVSTRRRRPASGTTAASSRHRRSKSRCPRARPARRAGTRTSGSICR